MSNFNKGGSGRPRGNDGGAKFGREGKPAFGKKSWGDKRSGDKPPMLYKATCANCHNSCEVPFRPNGERPVYCKDCFENKGGRGGSDRASSEEVLRPAGRMYDRSDGRSYQRDFAPQGNPMPHYESNKGNDDIKRQLELVNTKLERLIQAVEKMVPAKPAAEIVELKDVIATAMKKKKKATKK